MKKLLLTSLSFILLLLLSDCSSGGYTVSVNGDKADVQLKSGKNFSAEIVSISDSAVFFASTPASLIERPVLFYSLNRDIKSIEVEGYNSNGWITPVLLFQVLPVGLLTVAATSVHNTNAGIMGLVFMIPAVITSMLFISSNGHTPQWNDKQPLEEIKSLKIYSRYPRALSEDEINRLLKRYNQEVIGKYL